MTESRTAPTAGERLAKVIARAGLCSRRDAEGWIAAGRVAVNGRPVRTPAFNVTDRDTVEVDGVPLAARQGTRLWLYHKPAGLVVTESDPEGRPTVFGDVAEKGLPRVLSVGRLDINTEGLLLLTNDGGLKRVLELPSTGWLRKYRVRAFGAVTQEALDTLKPGVTVDGVAYGPIEAVLERVQGSNVWLLVSLREGRNREVKNVLQTLGLEVNRLIRVSYGPFQLGDIPVGAVETVKARVLRDQLGDKLARAAGADFDAPMPEPLPAAAKTSGPGRPSDENRPPRHRPGRHGFGERPARQAKPEPAPRRARLVHFDDGRPAESFVPKARRADDDRPPPRAGGRPARQDGERKPGSRSAERPARPDRPRAEGGGRPARAARLDHQRADGGERPARTDRPRGDAGGRPARRPRDDRRPAPTDGRPQRAGPQDRATGKPRGRPQSPRGARPEGKPKGPRGPRPGGPRPPRRER